MSQNPSGASGTSRIVMCVLALFAVIAVPAFYLLSVAPLVRIVVNPPLVKPDPARTGEPAWLKSYRKLHDRLAENAPLRPAMDAYYQWWGNPSLTGPAGYFTVYGQVHRQGRYELNPTHYSTISSAILRAGGFQSTAQDHRVKLIRKVPTKGSVTILVNVRDVLKGDLSKDIPILDKDVIVVQERIAP